MRKEFITAVLLTTLVAVTVFSSQRKGTELLEDQLGPDAQIGKQCLVLIAIDRYQEWLPLTNPVKDAKEIRSILESRYYIDTIYPLYNENATKGKIIKLFKQLQKDLKPEDSVLIFYSGHGYYEKSSKTGYWIPVDGGNDENLQDRWINNTRIKGLIGNIKSKHILLISDSCFSGQLLDQERGGPLPEINIDYFKEAYKYRSRQVLTSGALETVDDDSSFALQLKLFLEENNEPFLDPLEMFRNIRKGVKGSHPLLGELKGTGHQENASFILFLKQNQEPPKPTSIDLEKLEIKVKWFIWQRQFQADVEKLKGDDKNTGITNESKKAAWEKLLKHYRQDNPYSKEDDQLRDYAKARIQHWSNEANQASSPPAPGTGSSGLVTRPANVYIKIKNHTSERVIRGDKFPAKDTFTNIWSSSNMYAQEKKNYKFIIRLDKNMIYFIDHKDKSFVAASIPLDMRKVRQPGIAEMSPGATRDLTVNPNGQTRKLGDWNCSGYDAQSTFNIRSLLISSYRYTIWTTTDVPFDWKAFNEKFLSSLKTIGNLYPFTRVMSKELQKIKGFQIAVESSYVMRGILIKMSSTVMEIAEQAAPAGTYEVPADYTQKEYLSEYWWK